MDKRQALCRSIWKEVKGVQGVQKVQGVQDDACVLRNVRRALVEGG